MLSRFFFFVVLKLLVALQFSITFRYEAVMMRKRFDDTRSETDMKKLAAMLDEAEAEVTFLTV